MEVDETDIRPDMEVISSDSRRVGVVDRVEGGSIRLTKYGSASVGLHFDRSDDELWPVLAAFDGPPTGARRQLRFACAGPRPGLVPLAEGADAPSAAQALRASEDRADAASFDGDGGWPPGPGQADWQNRQDEVAADLAAAAVRR